MQEPLTEERAGGTDPADHPAEARVEAGEIPGEIVPAADAGGV